MDAVNQAIQINRHNPEAWLDLTEKLLLEKKINSPYTMLVRGKYTFSEHATDEKARSINKMVVEEVVFTANHIMDFLEACASKGREIKQEYMDALKNHTNFLDKYSIKRDKNQRYVFQR